MVTISRTEYEKLQAQSKRVSELGSCVDALMEALRLDQHKRFGASSEKSDDRLMEQLSFLFNEAEVFGAVREEDNSTVMAAHKRYKKHEYTMDSILEDLPPSGSSTIWRVRIWCAPSAGIAYPRSALRWSTSLRSSLPRSSWSSRSITAMPAAAAVKLLTQVVKRPLSRLPTRRASSPAASLRRRSLHTS